MCLHRTSNPAVPLHALLGAGTVVDDVTVTIVAVVAVAEAVVIPDAVTAGSANVVAVLVPPATAPFAEAANVVAAIAGVVVVAVMIIAAAGPSRRWLWRWRRSLRLFYA